MTEMAAIVLAMGAAFGSGLNLYATVLALGAMERFDLVALPPDLQILGTGPVLTAAAVLYAVEFFADKFPGLDTVWDVLHTFIRIPAGALLSAGAMGALPPELAGDGATALGLVMGGTVAAGAHFAKAGTRMLVNTSPEPFSNWLLSFLEDFLVFSGIFLAVLAPTAFAVGFALLLLFLIWLLPKLWRGVRNFLSRIRRPGSTARGLQIRRPVLPVHRDGAPGASGRGPLRPR